MNDDVQGSMYFSAKYFMQENKNVQQMMQRINPHKALVPVMDWLPGRAPSAPVLSNAAGSQGSGIEIQWTDSRSSSTAYYVVYRFEEGDTLNIENAAHIADIVPRRPYATQVWVDHNTGKRTEYIYVVTACDRLHHESIASTPLKVKTRGKRRQVKLASNASQ